MHEDERCGSAAPWRFSSASKRALPEARFRFGNTRLASLAAKPCPRKAFLDTFATYRSSHVPGLRSSNRTIGFLFTAISSLWCLANDSSVYIGQTHFPLSGGTPVVLFGLFPLRPRRIAGHQGIAAFPSAPLPPPDRDLPSPIPPRAMQKAAAAKVFPCCKKASWWLSLAGTNPRNQLWPRDRHLPAFCVGGVFLSNAFIGCLITGPRSRVFEVRGASPGCFFEVLASISW